MQFLSKYNQYKFKNKGKIVLAKLGAFYVAIGIDAYILNEIIGLKLTSFGKSKKVGIPLNSIKKYCSKMQNYDIPYAVYDEVVIYESMGSFDFVEKNNKIATFLNILEIKHEILLGISKYFCEDFGEIL